MLLFICGRGPAYGAATIIQIHLMLLFIRIIHIQPIVLYKFKYISCYCLSKEGVDFTVVWRTFKYISCYCLSRGSEYVKAST